MLKTESHRLLDRGRIYCRFENLTIDTVRNRFVRDALETIAKVVHHTDLARKCRSLSLSLRRMGVVGESPNTRELSIDRMGRNCIEDQEMVAAARLAFNLALPTEHEGDFSLSSPDRDIIWLRSLFEKGIAGFYDVVLSDTGWNVRAGKFLNWRIDGSTQGIDAILPSMKTDIILDHEDAGRRIIIDTKFNSVLTSGWHREESLRNGYHYQIYTYLRSQEGQADDPLAENASGVLLHPAVGGMLDEAVVIQ